MGDLVASSAEKQKSAIQSTLQTLTRKLKMRASRVSFTTDDLRIKWTKVLLPPAFLEESLPMTEQMVRAVHRFRREICDIINGKDDRLLLVVGPCSIHDVVAARDYALRLKTVRDELRSDACVVMRVYFEKPRTTVGWKGLINDPGLDGSFEINEGLRLARALLLDLAKMDLPAGTEFLDMIVPQYVGGLISWGAIGARTSASQLHRQLVSGLSCPVGFKNDTSGDVQIAVEAVQAAAHPHCFLGHTKYGQSAIFATKGNPDCHIILRGGKEEVNYKGEQLLSACHQLKNAGLRPRVMIDCSHGNCNKSSERQVEVCKEVADQIKSGSDVIYGIMIESNIMEGSQQLVQGCNLRYGQSVTDPCIGWDNSMRVLLQLRDAIAARRQRRRVCTYHPKTASRTTVILRPAG
jgi:3-deoxy-7-phosphoheptulonate synthase